MNDTSRRPAYAIISTVNSFVPALIFNQIRGMLLVPVGVAIPEQDTNPDPGVLLVPVGDAKSDLAGSSSAMKLNMGGLAGLTEYHIDGLRLCRSCSN
jgi:hypothetical protein